MPASAFRLPPSAFVALLTASRRLSMLLVVALAMHVPALAAEQPAQAKPASQGTHAMSSITISEWGTTTEGTTAHLFTLQGPGGLVARLTDFGARLVSLEVPDRQGKLADVTLGLDTVAAYERHTSYFGCTTGRYANRIAGGRFSLDGQTYQLAKNIDPNHLHGGKRGFDRYVWKAEPLDAEVAPAIRFTLRSPDGDEGFPGALDVTVVYRLTAENELRIDYEARTDKPTVLNLTNHAYWNLAGARSGTILGHRLMLAADKYVAIDDQAIPSGQLSPVAGTPLDFTTPHTIGERLAELKQGPPPGGYDHCYVLRGQDGKLALAARVEDLQSGRVMEVLTTEPGIQLYTANYLDGGPVNGGFVQHAALCLETQHYPDSPNQPSFPSTRLAPGEIYRQTTVHRFSTK